MRKQDLGVLMLHYAGYSLVRNVAYRIRGKRAARFVTFHDIPSDGDANLHAILCFLKENTNVISLDDYFAGKLSCKKANVVITFDDGYQSWISKAVPALKQHGLTGAFFVSSGFVGLSGDEEAEFIRLKLRRSRETSGGLSEEDVKRISDENFIIGGHTLNHVNLATIRDRTELRREILLDKRRLESIIGKKIEYFAYPFGAHRNPHIDLIKLLQEAGYRGAVTTIPGLNKADSNSHLLCRDLACIPMPLCVFKARVHGAYDAVMFLKNRGRELLGLRKRCRPL